MNKFADITNEEFRSLYLGKKVKGSKKVEYVPIKESNVDIKVDWTK